jgi:hypothetical protein
MILHLQEHKTEFAKIIADGNDLNVSTVMMSFKDLGYNYAGVTEVLLFESNVKAARNAYMLKQYANGNVKNHSVAMRYVQLQLAVNDEDYAAEYATWSKYYPMIANQEAADEQGYFWAVTEAKIIEGSAVPVGSNQVTPTIEITEPPKGTPKEPPQGTPTTKTNILINFLKY